MRITIHSALKRFTQGETQFELPDSTAIAFLSILQEHIPRLANCLVDEQGQLNPYISIFVNGSSLSQLPAERQLTNKDDIEIITSLVGG